MPENAKFQIKAQEHLVVTIIRTDPNLAEKYRTSETVLLEGHVFDITEYESSFTITARKAFDNEIRAEKEYWAKKNERGPESSSRSGGPIK